MYPQKTILVVEDSAPTRDLLGCLLRLEGYHAVTAADGQAAMEAVKREHPDVVVLDVTMPRIDGVQVLARLRADPESQRLPVVMFTDVSDGERADELRRLGVEDYIVKGSVSGWELLARIARQLPPS